MHFSTSPASGRSVEVTQLCPHAADAGALGGRWGGKEYFPAGKKEKWSHDHRNLFYWEKAVTPSQTGTA